MELRHIYYFIAVAEELHFGRAAKRLNISQPPLSTQIKRLETELNVLLLIRSKGHVYLTDAGHAFLKRAYEIIENVDIAIDDARKVDRGEVGQLQLGFTGAMVFDLLPLIFRKYKEKFPDVDILLRQLTTTEQVTALEEGSIQVGLLTLPIDNSWLKSELLREERLILALHKDHNLAQHEGTIDVASLSNEQFIMTPRSAGPNFYDSIISLCYQAGFSPMKMLEAQEIHTAASFVAAGMGIALLPASIRFMKNDDIIYKELNEVVIASKTGIAWNHYKPNTVVQSFISFLQQDIIPHL